MKNSTDNTSMQILDESSLEEVTGGGTGAGLMATALTVAGIGLCCTGVGGLAVAAVGGIAIAFASASEALG